MESREVRFQISASSVLKYLSYAVGIFFVISAICELTVDFGSGGLKIAEFFKDLGYGAFFGGLLYAFSYIVPWMMESLRR
jgi:hypothetical protein